MLLGEALKIVLNSLQNQFHPSVPQTGLEKAYETIKFAVDNNLEELIEQAVSELSKIPKEGVQELAIALTQIVEGGKE